MPEMRLRIWNVEHGACAMLQACEGHYGGRLAMIDSGHSTGFRPSTFIKHRLGRSQLDYLFITNGDQDHMSDLQGLWDSQIHVPVVHRNPIPNGAYRAMKIAGGGFLTDEHKRFMSINETHTAWVTEPFDQHMGGITVKLFNNPYPSFVDTNNLSLVVFVRYGTFQIVFPGDLEADGWAALLKDPGFRFELARTNAFVASHHGRENGYCPEVFDVCHPDVVVMSDKKIVHDTQLMSGTYGRQVLKHSRTGGVLVASANEWRQVLTTREDGHIQFEVQPNGDYRIYTGDLT
jgi:hypothetical protein